ncbi:MAG: hypothetical protein NTZ33_14675 [Bacteroidetes bacterium]|nr:hypothetical protein [Bacteroidota bacterium]
MIYFILKDSRDNNLINEGNILVNKVEIYKKTNGKLPLTLKEIGIKEDDNYPLFYLIRADSVNYMIWFGTSLGESKTYYSDSKKWEDFAR